MPLRQYWNVTKFTAGKRSEPAPTTDETECEWKTNIDRLNATIKDNMFWVHAKLIYRLGFLGEYLGRWGEGCPCHERQLLAGYRVECKFKQCRAPELAVGDGFRGLQEQLREFQQSLVPIATSASLSLDQQRKLIMTAGQVASGLISELRMKFCYFEQLPHCLCGLGHHDTAKASMAAKRCLEAFDGTSPGSLHRLSKRFLDPTWTSTATGEISLRQFVLRMANGENVFSIGNEEFTHWVTSLATIRIIERPVEGLHSRVSRITKQSPNQSMSLISLDLRFASLLELMRNQPALLHHCKDDILLLERSNSFRSVVKKHLGINLDLDSDRAMANLLYRENLRMKHSKKEKTKTILEQHKSVFGNQASARSVTAGIMEQVMGNHLALITSNDSTVFFIIPHDLFSKWAVKLEDVAAGKGWGPRATTCSLICRNFCLHIFQS